MQKIEILHVDACPNWLEIDAQVRSVTAEFGAPDANVKTALAGLPRMTQLRDVLRSKFSIAP